MAAPPTTPNPTSASVGACHRRLVRHLDLFSGIGGFALAAQMAGGIETVAFCEIDPWAQKVLAKNFPGVPIHDDVRTLNPDDYGRIDLVSGGYPCQPFSLAGKREGEADDRHLWPAMRRIIEDSRPRWVLAENVVGHVSMGIDTVLSELETLGYSCGATVLPACAVDAPHRRDRVWIVANSDRIGLQGERVGGKSGGKSGGKFAGSAIAGGCNQEDDSNADRWRQQERVQRDSKTDEPGQQAPRGNDADGLCKAAPHAERGLCDGRANQSRGETKGRAAAGGYCGWEPEPAVGRVANGIPNRVDRLRGLGNAIVPQVAAEILRAMLSVDPMTNVKS